MLESNGRKSEKEENKLLVAKALDKENEAVRKNKITYTDFLTASEEMIIKKSITKRHLKIGVRNEADRNIIIFYPDKFSENIVRDNLNNILQVIRIKFPRGVSFEHREILSGIMKLGIKREKFGDIVVYEEGADIIILKEISKILIDGLSELTRFKKSEIFLVSINEIHQKENEYENLKIIISSNRLDNFVSELARCSRTKAIEIIEEGRVFINNINEFKISKKLNIGDVINIRGKGKFIFDGEEAKTKSDRSIILIRKYI